MTKSNVFKRISISYYLFTFSFQQLVRCGHQTDSVQLINQRYPWIIIHRRNVCLRILTSQLFHDPFPTIWFVNIQTAAYKRCYSPRVLRAQSFQLLKPTFTRMISTDKIYLRLPPYHKWNEYHQNGPIFQCLIHWFSTNSRFLSQILLNVCFVLTCPYFRISKFDCTKNSS